MTRCRVRFLFVVFLSAAHCARPSGETFLIKYNDVTALEKGSAVHCKGAVVGSITDMKMLSDYTILVQVNLDESFKPTRNDTFALSYSYGARVIEILRGQNSKQLYTAKDTIIGVINDRQPLDSAERKIIYDRFIKPWIEK